MDMKMPSNWSACEIVYSFIASVSRESESRRNRHAVPVVMQPKSGSAGAVPAVIALGTDQRGDALPEPADDALVRVVERKPELL